MVLVFTVLFLFSNDSLILAKFSSQFMNIEKMELSVLVHLGCCNKNTMWLKQQTCISHSSGAGKSHDLGSGRVRVWGGSTS